MGVESNMRVGDMVCIIKKPPTDRYVYPGFPIEMDKYCGRVATIAEICMDDEIPLFKVMEDETYFWWRMEWLIPLHQRTE